ncbi:unnamed protein product, partial [Closterium sp. NIES-54]
YSCSCSYCTTATVPAATAAIMATPSVLSFDAEGRPIKFEVWLDDLHLFLQITAKDDVSLYDHTSGAAPAPPTTADSTARSQWQTRDAYARLAVCNHLPLDERKHFGQHKTAKELYDAVVARYSSPATAAIGRFSLPYLFPDLSAFATVVDLITHLRTSDLRYRAALPPDFLAKNPPPMYLTLYHLVTRLPDSLRTVRDQFLALSPTDLTVDLLEKELLAAEKSIVAVAEGVGVASAPSGARGAGVVEVDEGAAAVEGVGWAGVVAGVGVARVVGGSVAAQGVVAVAVVGVVGAVGAVEAVVAVVERCSVGGSAVARGSSSRLPRPSNSVSGTLSVGGLGGRYLPFPDATELPRWADLLRKNIDIFALDFDAILGAIYALTISIEGDCYLSVPPDRGIGTSETAPPGASASAALGPGEAAALGTRASAALGPGEAAALGASASAALGPSEAAALGA